MVDAPTQQQLTETVIETLSEVKQRDGAGVAYQTAEQNIRASTSFILSSIGPQAARRALTTTIGLLEEDIRAANANSGGIQ